jgi:hypothetical protein
VLAQLSAGPSLIVIGSYRFARCATSTSLGRAFGWLKLIIQLTGIAIDIRDKNVRDEAPDKWLEELAFPAEAATYARLDNVATSALRRHEHRPTYLSSAGR